MKLLRRLQPSLARKTSTTTTTQNLAELSVSTLSSSSDLSSDHSQEDRRVSFNESCNQVYDNETNMTKEDVKQELWFSKQENAVFRQDHYKNVDTTTMIESMNPDSWLEMLGDAFEGFCNVKATKHVQKVTDTIQPNMLPAKAVGLDAWALGARNSEKNKRRRELLQSIKALQKKGANVDQLRETCRKVSQPCRLYARHVAHVAMQSDI